MILRCGYEPEIISSLPCERVFEDPEGVTSAASQVPAKQCAVKVRQRNEFGGCMSVTINTTVYCQIAWGDQCGGGGGEN